MPDVPDATTYPRFIQAQAAALRSGDAAPVSRDAWEQRRRRLRQEMFAAMGGQTVKDEPLQVREVGVLKRDGYRIEKLLIRTRPDVWMTASAYVPENVKGRVPAVLVVHGHWAWARRDPVVQARCLGLVKLGFFVLAVDAFGAGERHPSIGAGAYHGALIGSALWPVGHSLLGMQVYDNRRAVDYLRTRPEVEGERLGITGASGGGNQTMYAGALDERFRAVVPVCSVGNYQVYLKTACCVCEVLPGALRFTEEGDVLGLVAPRALLVINATKDGIQFSVAEAEKSVARAKAIFKLYGADEKLAHVPYESPHAYNQAMREAMYGWMTRWLKGEGDGKPIPEPKHEIEKVEALACFPDGKRPDGFLFPASFAAREAATLLEPFRKGPPSHKEAWEAETVVLRGRLQEALGPDPRKEKLQWAPGKVREVNNVERTEFLLQPEAGITLAGASFRRTDRKRRGPLVVLLHPDGEAAAFAHPLATAFLTADADLYTADLRATGAAKPADGVGTAVDHNAAEHAVWVGRPLLGQWVVDVRSLLDALPQGKEEGPVLLVGVGAAGPLALCVAALDERIAAVAAVDSPLTLVSEVGFAPPMRMALLVPSILRGGDIPHWAALIAPRRLLIAGGVDPLGKKLDEKALTAAFAFPQGTYKLLETPEGLRVRGEMTTNEVVKALVSRS
jgi:dienelactone hydrolase